MIIRNHLNLTQVSRLHNFQATRSSVLNSYYLKHYPMKNFYVFLFCFTLFSTTTLFSQNWSWARAGNSLVSGSDQGNDVAVDLNGNVYITGSFSGPGITFTSP